MWRVVLWGLASAGLPGVGYFVQIAVAQDVSIPFEQLLDRIVERDPRIAELRRSVLEAELAVGRAYEWQEPEVRLSYANTSRSAVPGPYQEIREETITQRGTSLDEGVRTGTERSTERRVDRSPRAGDPLQPSASETIGSSSSYTEGQRETRDFVETTTRRTIREVTPGSRSTVIRQRTEESVREDYTDRATSSGRELGLETRTPDGASGADPQNFAQTRFSADTRSQEQLTDQGVERTRLVEERVEEQTHSRDPFEGSEDYEVELRVRPPNPWEMRARREQARAGASGAAFALEAAERLLRLEVQALFLELQFAVRELDLLRRAEEWSQREVALNQELMAAGETSLGDVADRQVNAFQLRRDRAALEAEFLRGRDALAARAGLPQPESIGVDGPLAVPAYRPEELESQRLLPAILDLHEGLGRLATLQRGLQQELSIVHAQRIPWFSVVSASYRYETRYGDKYRDEYQFMVGVEIPIFAWFKDDDHHLTRQLEWARGDEATAEERIRLELDRGIERLQRRALTDRAEQADHQALRDRLQQAIQDLPESNLMARRQRLILQRAILDLEESSFELERDRAMETLAFEMAMGARLAEVLGLAADEPNPNPEAEGSQG